MLPWDREWPGCHRCPVQQPGGLCRIGSAAPEGPNGGSCDGCQCRNPQKGKQPQVAWLCLEGRMTGEGHGICLQQDFNHECDFTGAEP